jgi:hypothetical protein
MDLEHSVPELLLGHPPADAPGEEVVREQARDFFAGMSTFNYYPKFRIKILDFCLRQAIAPERLAEVGPDRLTNWLSKSLPVSRALATDWPLRSVYRACRLFRD